MNLWIPVVQLALLVAGPAAADDGSPPIAIDIDTSKLGEFGVVFDRRLEHEIRAVAKQRGIAVVQQARGRIRVEVTDTSGKGTAFEYAVETTPWAADAGRTSQQGKCAPCTEEMTVAKIKEALGARFDALADAPKEATPAAVVADPVGSTVAPPASHEHHDGQNDNQNHKKIGSLGWAGIGVTLAGVAVGGGGIALLLRDDRLSVDETAPLQVERTSTRRSGIALAAVGGALAVGGVAMIVVDQVKLKRRRMAWAPAMAPGFAGLELSGRF